MKKLFVYFLLVCIIAMNVVACTKAPYENAGQSNPISGTVDNTHIDVPRVLRFESLEEVPELKEMLEKSDEEVTEYLSEKSFNMNGLNSKEDIEAFFEKIGDLKILHLKENSGYDLSFIHYNVDSETVDISYKNKNGYVKFTRYLPNSKSLSDSAENDKQESTLALAEEKLTILNEPIQLRVWNDTENFYRLRSVFDMFGSRVIFVLSDKTKSGFDLAAIEQNIIETTLNELIEQKLK